mmetsp:Transcript_31155/g.60716  ORF Transcript_31155/g.60716 Transcript_31155/m.60716 type:complete len:227 (+) Transcript_31155:35-715(+)
MKESCPICLEGCFRPVVTDCQHSFCEQCIGNLLSRENHVCPSCRQPVQSIDSQTQEKTFTVKYRHTKCTFTRVAGEGVQAAISRIFSIPVDRLKLVHAGKLLSATAAEELLTTRPDAILYVVGSPKILEEPSLVQQAANMLQRTTNTDSNVNNSQRSVCERLTSAVRSLPGLLGPVSLFFQSMFSPQSVDTHYPEVDTGRHRRARERGRGGDGHTAPMEMAMMGGG